MFCGSYLKSHGGVVRISTSSDGDDQRIFLGLKFSIPGYLFFFFFFFLPVFVPHNAVKTYFT